MSKLIPCHLFLGGVLTSVTTAGGCTSGSPPWRAYVQGGGQQIDTGVCCPPLPTFTFLCVCCFLEGENMLGLALVLPNFYISVLLLVS